MPHCQQCNKWTVYRHRAANGLKVGPECLRKINTVAARRQYEDASQDHDGPSKLPGREYSPITDAVKASKEWLFGKYEKAYQYLKEEFPRDTYRDREPVSGIAAGGGHGGGLADYIRSSWGTHHVEPEPVKSPTWTEQRAEKNAAYQANPNGTAGNINPVQRL